MDSKEENVSPELKIDDVSSFMTGAESDLENSLKMLSISDVKHDLYDNRGSNRTGLVYHPDMDKHRCLWDENYEEKPERFTSILERIKDLGLDERCELLTPRSATEEEILLIHSREYLDKIKSTSGLQDVVKLEELSSEFDAVYFHPDTYDLALLSAGSGLDLVTQVVKGELKNGFALIRPPGHHAMYSEACGYCFFNNIAIAAKHATDDLGLERVLIVDWDVHHGQATQYSFDEDPRVFYMSIHRYEHGAFWPELIESNSNWIGVSEGLGYNCNIPLNETGIHDKDYLAIFHNVILPLAYRFNPQLVLISAGYDAAIGCPEGEMRVSPATYAHMCHSLMSLAEGKVCVFLEGGYCIESLSEAAALTLKCLLGDPCPKILPLPKLKLHKSLLESVLDTISAIRNSWEGLFAVQGSFDRHSAEETQMGEGEVAFLRPRHYPVVEYKGTLAFKDKPTKYPTRNCYPLQSPETKLSLQNEIRILKESTDISNPFLGKKRTCIMYNELMTRHKCMEGSHPERPTRIKAIYKKLSQRVLLDECIVSNEMRYATDDELKLVHTPEYLDKIKRLKGMSQKDIRQFADSLDSIYMNKETEENSRLATGSLLSLVDKVVGKDVLNGMAVIRPPGHHSSSDSAAGFCIFSNVAIAAKYAITKHGVKKILIVDFDVHHGDGTQSVVKGDPNILFISIHRYDCADFYPSTVASGLKTSEKNIINIPWNHSMMGSSEYISAFLNIILPVSYDFDPDLVFVSAGFDAAINDPLGHYHVLPEAYGHFIHQLMSLAEGRVIIALEGGYNLESISSAAAYCVSGLLGRSLPRLELSALDPNSQETLKEVVDFHSIFWPSLKFGVDLPLK